MQSTYILRSQKDGSSMLAFTKSFISNCSVSLWIIYTFLNLYILAYINVHCLPTCLICIHAVWDKGNVSYLKVFELLYWKTIQFLAMILYHLEYRLIHFHLICCLLFLHANCELEKCKGHISDIIVCLTMSPVSDTSIDSLKMYINVQKFIF